MSRAFPSNRLENQLSQSALIQGGQSHSREEDARFHSDAHDAAKIVTVRYEWLLSARFLVGLCSVLFVIGLLATTELVVMAGPAPDALGAPRDDSGVDWVCQRYPDRVAKLLSALNLDHPGLGQVKTAVEKKDWPAACRSLLDYYRKGTTVRWLRHEPVPPGNQTDPNGEVMLKDTYTFYGVTARIPRLENGHRNWDYRGPDPALGWEWTSCLNRQDHLTNLLGIYFVTGNAVYVRYIDNYLADWVLANPPPADGIYYNSWSPINMGLRMTKWPALFYGLQRIDAFTEATRILMLSSAFEQGQHLRTKHSPDTNHLLMEMHGLEAIAVAWPEFADATGWLQYAKSKMAEQLTATVYPDGTHNELTDSYHQVVLGQFQGFLQTLRSAGQRADPSFEQIMEKMWNYVAYAVRPNGYGPHNNESDLIYNRKNVLDAAKTYERSDWVYIATNGREGQKPAGLPSVVFPWAGQVVMRSGWDADAQWAFFDIGPAGLCHENLDKLHLSVSAFGHDWLVDSGRYTYSEAEGWRNHFVGSAAHNVILIDGHGQNVDDRTAKTPLASEQYALNPAFDFARGTFDKGFEGIEGQVAHTRAVFYLRGRYWVVVDRISTDRPRTIQPLWHFHPDCAVSVEQDSVVATQAGGRLSVIPVSDLKWNVKLVKGQTEPSKQGWYSVTYGSKVPSPVAIYSASIANSAVFAWLLVPAADSTQKVTVKLMESSAERISLQIGFSGDPMTVITLPLDKGPPIIDAVK